MKEDTPPRRGRKPVPDPCREWVSTKLPTRAHDRLIKLAGTKRQTVSSLVRQMLMVKLK